MDRRAADRTAAGGAGFERGAGSAISCEKEMPDFRSVTGARHSKIGFHADCHGVPALPSGTASRWLISTGKRAAKAIPREGERGVSAASPMQGAMVDRITVAARTSPGSRDAHLGRSGRNPACGRSAGAWAAGVIHSGAIDAPRMRGRPLTNGNSPRPVEGARAGHKPAAPLNPAKPETRTADEPGPVGTGKTGCACQLRDWALLSTEATRCTGAESFLLLEIRFLVGSRAELCMFQLTKHPDVFSAVSALHSSLQSAETRNPSRPPNTLAAVQEHLNYVSLVLIFAGPRTGVSAAPALLALNNSFERPYWLETNIPERHSELVDFATACSTCK